MKEIQNKYTNKSMQGQYAQALESEQIDKKKIHSMVSQRWVERNN